MIDRGLRNLSQIFIRGNLLEAIAISSEIGVPELPKTLTVTGNGTESIATTTAFVRLGVEIEGKTVSEVEQEIAIRTSNIIGILRSQGVEQLQTTGVRLNPNYDRLNRNSDQSVILSYAGTTIVSFQVSKELVSKLLDEAVTAGASRIDGISFTATDEAISQAKEEALRKASIDAQNKANVVFKTLNLTANKIVNIKVDRASIEPTQALALEQSARSPTQAITPILSGEYTVEAAVTLEISY